MNPAPPPAAYDEGIPEWLRQLQANQPPGPVAQGPYAGGPPQGYAQPVPPPAYGGAPVPAQPMSAANLVSEDALPEWLRAAGDPSPAPAQPGWQQPSPVQPAQAGWAQPSNPAQSWQQANAGMPAAPGGQTPGAGWGAPASALFDESALPEWLRNAAAGQEIETQSPAYNPAPAASPYGVQPQSNGFAPAAGWGGYQAPQPPSPGFPPSNAGAPDPMQPSNAFPPIERAGSARVPPPGAGVTGATLIDPAALPQWLGGQPGAPTNAGPAGVGAAGGGMPAQSLIDESALPQWLRAEPNQPAGSTPMPPAAATPSASQWLASSTADEPLPGWLSQAYADANVPQYPEPPAAPGMPRTDGAPRTGWDRWAQPPAPGQIAASDFVDESVLPEWLRAQGAVPSTGASPAAPAAGTLYTPHAPAAQPERAIPPYVPGSFGGNAAGIPAGMAPGMPGAMPAANPASEQPIATFSASDLIDPSALPDWVQGGTASEQMTFNSTEGWTSKAPAAPSAGVRGQSYEPSGRLDDYSANISGGSQVYPAASRSWEMPAQQGTGTSVPAGWSVDPDFDWPADPGSSVLPATYADRGAQPPTYADRGASTSMANRRGPPIPHEQLPPWLTAGARPGSEPGRRENPAARGYQQQAYPDNRQGGRGRQYDDGMDDWDAANARYSDEFERGSRADEHGRGTSFLRRFFGRK